MLYTIWKECESYQRMQVVEANSVNCDIRSSGGHGKLTMARCQIVFTQSKTFWRKFYVVCRDHIILDTFIVVKQIPLYSMTLLQGHKVHRFINLSKK